MTLDGFTRLKVGIAQRAEFLDKTKWGRDFDWDALNFMAQYFQMILVDKGQHIFREGDREPFMGLIQKGSVKVMKAGAGGKMRRICSLGVGQAFGEMSLVDGSPRSATVTALEPVALLVMSAGSFDRLSQERPLQALHLMRKIAQLMSNRLRQTSGILMDHLDEAG